ncbi:MAG: hypothetical protein HUK03_09785, partial [Bacteroidaceae bacterium]|nr:hypothetical protein [Bacteroidaceae bacterium]
RRYGVMKLHPHSHLFTSDERVADFPGRTFTVETYGGFGKKEVSKVLGGIKRANLTARNFPTTVQELRRRLHLAEGGDTYLFATTLASGEHALIKCRK